MKTIEHAMDQDRDIFAVPGNIDAPRSEGPQLAPSGRGPPGDLHPGHPGGVLAPLSSEAGTVRPAAAGGGPAAAGAAPEPERPGGDRAGGRSGRRLPHPAAPRRTGAPDLERVPRGEQRSRFTDDQLTLLRAMAGRKKTCTADELVEETQIPARRVLSALTMLQVDGAAREHPGKRFSPLVELEE